MTLKKNRLMTSPADQVTNVLHDVLPEIAEDTSEDTRME
jgi:hypothetical protein